MNSSLYGKEYVVPNNILSILQGQDSRRSNNLVNNGKISYSLLKKMKSDIDNGISDYGQEVSNWINNQLRTSRSGVYDTNKNMMDTGIENRFKKTHTKDKNVNSTVPSGVDTTHKEFMRESITSEGKKVVRLTENELKELIENALLKEEYKSEGFNIDKASTLVDYLMAKFPNNEIGVSDIQHTDEKLEEGVDVYVYISNKRTSTPQWWYYRIFTDEELRHYKNKHGFLPYWKITRVGDYNIIHI